MSEPVSPSNQLADLREQGWCVIENAVDPAMIAALEEDLAPGFAETRLSQGAFYGARTRRFGGLLNRSTHAQSLVMHDGVLDLVDTMLGPWCDCIALNLTQAIEIHPGALPQFPHRDQDMWGGPKGEVEYLVNVMWPLTPFTRANGGTRLWSGTHTNVEAPDPSDKDSLVPSVSPGDALVFLGSTLHAGGGNRTDAPRRGVVVSYCLGWLKPFELQWLVYPPAVARNFTPELAALIGYAQHRPNLGNVEGQCPSMLLRDEVPSPLGAVDALRPDQEEAAAAFVAGQLGEMG